MRHHSPPEVLDVINLSIPWRNLFPRAFTDAFSIPLLTQKRMAEKKNPSPTGIEKKWIKFMLNTRTIYIYQSTNWGFLQQITYNILFQKMITYNILFVIYFW